jgi:hypothetical protein
MSVSMSAMASKPKVKLPGTHNPLIGFDMTSVFPLGTLIGSPTITVIDSEQAITGGASVADGDVTWSTPIVNTVAFSDDEGGTVNVGFGIQSRPTGGVHGGNYLLKVVGFDAGTTNGDGYYCVLQVRQGSL